SLFTSPPSSLILLLHGSHHSPHFSSFHCRSVSGNFRFLCIANAKPPRLLRAQTARRPRPPNHRRRIPRPPPPRAIPDGQSQSRLRRPPHRPRPLPILFHRHPLVAQRTPAGPDHPAHRPTHPHLSRLRRIPHARIFAL